MPPWKEPGSEVGGVYPGRGDDGALKMASDAGEEAMDGEWCVPKTAPATVRLLGDDGSTLDVGRLLDILLPPLPVDDVVCREVDERQLPALLDRSLPWTTLTWRSRLSPRVKRLSHCGHSCIPSARSCTSTLACECGPCRRAASRAWIWECRRRSLGC